jgi:hypothetical protein
MYYGWSKEFLEAGKRRLAGDTARAATSGEVKDLRRETTALKEVVADLTLENRLLKKSRSSRNRVGRFERLKGHRARYFGDILHFCRVQNLAPFMDGKTIETPSAALGYVFI